MSDWKDFIAAEDFPESFEPFIDVLGVEKTVELAERMGGLQFYLPKIDKIKMQATKRMIRADRDSGMSYRAIALKHRVTEIMVRVVCDANRREATACDRQMTLF